MAKSFSKCCQRGARSISHPALTLVVSCTNLTSSGKPAAIETGALVRKVRLTAAVTLTSRHWPSEGSRHDAALAFSGMACKAGYTKEEVVKAMTTVADIAGDNEIPDRISAAKDTCKNWDNGSPIAGYSKYVEVMGADVAKKLGSWLSQCVDDELDQKVEELNEKHAVVMTGGTCRIMNIEQDLDSLQKVISFSSEKDFKLFYANEDVCVGVVEEWLAIVQEARAGLD